MWLNSQLMFDNVKKAKMAYEARQIEYRLESAEESDLMSIHWIWKGTADKLFAAWIKSARQLKNRDMDTIKWIISNPLALENIEKFLNTNIKD